MIDLPETEPEPQRIEAMNLRVLTLNVWNTDGPVERQEQLRNAIRLLDVDLISLQEVVKTTGYDQLEFLLGGTGLHLVHESQLLSRPGWGTALASRWIPTHIEAQQLTSTDPGPSVIAAAIPLPIGEELLFVAAKPSYKFSDEAARCRQATEIAALEERLRRTAPSVIAGDFDASPDHQCMRFYTGRAPLDGRSVHFRDAWAAAGGDGPGYTWTSDNDWVAAVADSGWIQLPHRRRIDYVLVGSPEHHPDVMSSITAARVVLNSDPAPSDHYGVIAEIELRRRH